FYAPVLHGDADDTDTYTVHDDGDGYRRKKNQRALPERTFVQHSDQEPEAHQREQVIQATTGLGHLELIRAEINDIALRKNADIHQLDNGNTEFGRDQLELSSQQPQDEHRERDHKYQVGHGRPGKAYTTPSNHRQHQGQ